MNIFRSLFSKKEKEISEDDHIKRIVEMYEASMEPGRELADHIVHNILAKGNVGSLNDIRTELEALHENPTPIMNGLMERFIKYRDKQIIFTFSSKNNDTILVHKDYVDSFMSKL